MYTQASARTQCLTAIPQRSNRKEKVIRSEGDNPDFTSAHAIVSIVFPRQRVSSFGSMHGFHNKAQVRTQHSGHTQVPTVLRQEKQYWESSLFISGDWGRPMPTTWRWRGGPTRPLCPVHSTSAAFPLQAWGPLFLVEWWPQVSEDQCIVPSFPEHTATSDLCSYCFILSVFPFLLLNNLTYPLFHMVSTPEQASPIWRLPCASSDTEAASSG